MSSVLDASALLAYVLDEIGAQRVLAALRNGAAIGAANWAEALSRLADLGADPTAEAGRLRALLGDRLAVVALDEAQADQIARLRPLTRHLGLSLGDRACLALGAALRLPVVTADRSWAALGVGVRVEVIR